MEDYLREAVEIVKAQAGVRAMTHEEIAAMVKGISESLKQVASGETPAEASLPTIEPGKSIKEKTVVCLECNNSFKVLTKRHLAIHGLTPSEYKAKHGIPKNTALIAKHLGRERRKKMKDMRLWEKRKGGTASSAA